MHNLSIAVLEEKKNPYSTEQFWNIKSMVGVRIGPCCHQHCLHNKMKNALYYIVLICLAKPLPHPGL